MNPLRTIALILCWTCAIAQDGDPGAAVAQARAALAAGTPGQVVLASGADGAARARIDRLAAAVQAGRFDLIPLEQRIEGDCAAVLVEGSRPRGGRPDRFGLYLVHEDGAWKLLPDPTRPLAADPGRTDRLAMLAAWVSDRAQSEPVVLAGDALATWMLGAATAADRPLRPGAAIALGQRVVVGPGKPGRMVLNQLDGSSVTCAGGTVVTLTEEPVDGGKDLVIDLEDGAVQVDVHARGPYAHVRVRGLASDVTVTGTIFLVQRVAKDGEYVAQVDGTVRVRARNGDATVNLAGRQGVAVGIAGLDPVDLLLTRPQLLPERLAQGDLRSQGLKADPAGGGWDQDPIRDQSPRVVTAEEQAQAQAQAAAAAAAPEVQDAAAPPAAASAPAATGATTKTATGSSSPSSANQLGVANPGLGGDRGQGGVTTSPSAAAGGSSGGSAGGVSPGASPAPLSGHPGLPGP